MAKSNRSGGSTLEKVLSILEVIVEQPQSVGLPDLADVLGMSRQSLHRLLHQLEPHGLAVKVPNRDRFAIGLRFSKLALHAICSSNQGPALRDIIQRAVSGIGETCNAGVLAGREYVCIERVECERLPRIYLETGSRLPPHVTSGGKAILSFLPDKVRSRLIETLELKKYTDFTITEKDAFVAELDQIRERGHAVAWQEFSEGIVGVGVPIIGHDGFPLASLALHAPIQRISKGDAPPYAQKLQIAAAELAEVCDIDF